ncbi:MAG: BlaI/MecI/CopY family transcriptional regulator [Bacteroidia bacterium]|nr:BlaI/MecI/CopY family transcriptional regulator [Bacteroidia bacterium]
MKLPEKEEQVMSYLWKLKKAFMKDLLEAYPDPKPSPSTLATHLKRLQQKEAVDFKTYGSVREYYPLISRDEYFSGKIKQVINNFFDGSKLAFASFFTSETALSEEEILELKKMLDEKLNSQK